MCTSPSSFLFFGCFYPPCSVYMSNTCAILLVTHLLMCFLSLLHIGRANCLCTFLSHEPTNRIEKAPSSPQKARSQCEMNVIYNCREVMYSSSTEETKGSVKILRYLTSVSMKFILCSCMHVKLPCLLSG